MMRVFTQFPCRGCHGSDGIRTGLEDKKDLIRQVKEKILLNAKGT